MHFAIGKAVALAAVSLLMRRLHRLRRFVVAARATALEKRLDAAKKNADAGDRDGATHRLKEVWDQRCLAPKRSWAAQKVLGRLGVEVKDAQRRRTDPIMTRPMNARMTAAMDCALAELPAGPDRRDRSSSLRRTARARS